MAEDFCVRQGTLEDIDDLLVMYTEVQEAVAGTDNDPLWRVGVHPCREQLEAAVEADALFVGFKGGRVVGALVCNETAAPGYEAVPWQVEAAPGEFVTIHLFGMNPAFRGQGLARPFMEAVEAEAARRGYRAVRLDTLITNVGAQRAYERLGYRNMGRHHLTYGTYIDTEEPRFVLYEKVL